MQAPHHPDLASSLDGPTPMPLGLAILTVSDTRSIETDKSGQRLVNFCESAGHRLVTREIVKDDLATIRAFVEREAARSEVQVILVTGGTGITARDVTPEAIEPLLDKVIPGFGELFRSLSYGQIGAATIQSRAFAGLVRGKLVFALPGSTGAVDLAVEAILRPQLDRRTRPCNFAELLERV